jgi:hypothetical protein
LLKICQQKPEPVRSATRKFRGIPFSKAAAPCAPAQNSIFL